MKRQPTQVEEKAKADMGLGRRKKRRRPVTVDIDIEDGDPPTTIDLNKKNGFWDTTVYPYDMGDDDAYPMTTEFKPHECLICGQITTHGTPWCPYKEFVPHDVTLPPGIDRACTCCGKIGGHPGQDWEGFALPKKCRDCGAKGEHWTGDSDCPTKAAPTGTAPSETAPTGTAPTETAPTETRKPQGVKKLFSIKKIGNAILLLDEVED